MFKTKKIMNYRVRLTVYLIASLWFFFFGCGQPSKTSLRNTLSQNNSEKERIKSLIDSAQNNRNTSLDKSFVFIDSALELSSKNAFFYSEYVLAKMWKASFYRRVFQFENSLKILKDLLVLDTIPVTLKARINQEMAFLQLDQRLWPNAILYYKKALRFNQESGDIDATITQNNNIADAYIQLGDLVLAQYYLHQAISINSKHQTKKTQTNFELLYGTLGEVYLKEGNLNVSLYFFRKSLALNPSKITKKYQVVFLLLAAKAAILLKDYALFKHYKARAMPYVKDSKDPEISIQINDLLYIEYKQTGNYLASIEKLEEKFKLQENLMSKEFLDQTKELEAQHSIQLASLENKKNIDLLKKEHLASSQRIVLILVFFILLTIVSIYFFIQKNRDNHKLLKQKATIEGQNSKIKFQATELELKNSDLVIKNEELQASEEELSQNLEELKSIQDMLEKRNQKILAQQEVIEIQNKEILLRNENLEETVEQRTVELIENNRQLEQYAFITAHNLRAPVARILGLGNLLKYLTSSEEKEENINRLINTTKELDMVVKDINSILEIKKGSNDAIVEINLSNEIVQVEKLLENTISSVNAVIVKELSQVNVLRTVKPYLTNVIFNLISNSIKFRHSTRNPLIKIQSQIEGGFAKLIFSDNGIGIDMQISKGKIFGLYQRFHLHIEGKGLGLFLIKTQLDSLGGKIEFTSRVDEGSVFTVYLPLE
jgi:signal transduction histidine kinase